MSGAPVFPDLAELLRLVEVVAVTGGIVLIFLAVNWIAVTAADRSNRSHP